MGPVSRCRRHLSTPLPLHDVDVPPNLVRSRSAEPFSALALVSGRTIGMLDRLFAPLSLTAAGEHGAELRPGPGQPIARCSSRLLDPGLKAALQQLVIEHPALLLEEKPASIVVHYRRAPRSPGVERRLQAILTKADQASASFPARWPGISATDPAPRNGAVQIMALERFVGGFRLASATTDRRGRLQRGRAMGHALAVAGECASRAPVFASPAAVRS
jgi:hypothetical protein